MHVQAITQFFTRMCAQELRCFRVDAREGAKPEFPRRASGERTAVRLLIGYPATNNVLARCAVFLRAVGAFNRIVKFVFSPKNPPKCLKEYGFRPLNKFDVHLITDILR